MSHAVSRLLAGAAAATLLVACGGPDAGPVLAPFQAELDRLAREAEAAQRIAVRGLDGWLFLAPELRQISLDGFHEPGAGDPSTSADRGRDRPRRDHSRLASPSSRSWGWNCSWRRFRRSSSSFPRR